MFRSLVNIAMVLMLILQGVTLAGAEVLPANDIESMTHCAGHEAAGSDCACCSDSEMKGINCAAQCSVAVCMSASIPVFDAERTMVRAIPTCVWGSGPSYSPLNPPPIA